MYHIPKPDVQTATINFWNVAMLSQKKCIEATDSWLTSMTLAEMRPLQMQSSDNVSEAFIPSSTNTKQ